MHYEIGQVLFVNFFDGSIRPIRVIEELIKKAINGEERVYNVEYYNSEGMLVTTNLNKIAAASSIFISTSDLCNNLYQGAIKEINRLHHKLLESAKIEFGYNQNQKKDQQNNAKSKNENKKEKSKIQQEQEEPNDTTRNVKQIILENGTVANIDIDQIQEKMIALT